MPNKHFYFSMGALTGLTISWCIRKARFWLLKRTDWMKRIYSWNRYWYLYFLPCCVSLFGMVALTPDFLYHLGILPKSVTRGKLFNLFFFHSYFEHVEDVSPKLDHYLNWIGELLLMLIANAILLFYAQYLNQMIQKKLNYTALITEIKDGKE